MLATKTIQIEIEHFHFACIESLLFVCAVEILQELLINFIETGRAALCVNS
jgi:hypothetical protein